jgi:predicted dehydrogenase
MPDILRIAFIGASFVNFGGGEGPWDHASRLEVLPGVEFVAICDLDEARAQATLDRRRAGAGGARYNNCLVCRDWEAMLDDLRPDAVFIGLPPSAHGKASGPGAVELGCARRGVHVFIEKPLANGDPAAVNAVAAELAEARARDGAPLIVSVGYMLRYSNMVEHLRRVVRTEAAAGRPPRVYSGRYCSAYSTIFTRQFWDRAMSGGPIIEQATHFVDLARYLLGEVDLDSVQAQAIPASHALGNLTDMPVLPSGAGMEDGIPAERRIPRATVATWRFESGALGTLTHGLLQQGRPYESELEVWGDGLKAVLTDPYSDAVRLEVRHAEFTSVPCPMAGPNDPYLAEDDAFLTAIRGNRPDLIRSPYSDAAKTFALTCKIADAAG